MKTKRSSHLQKKNRPEVNNEPLVNPSPLPLNTKVDSTKKGHGDCDGVCPINWKPAAVSR
ncbi:MAG TPA: hypothetical protein V6D22_08205 [Candidatus Obscuribacterales bacterium]